MGIFDMIAPGVDFEKIQEQITGFVTAAGQMKDGIEAMQNQLDIIEDRIEYLTSIALGEDVKVSRETTTPETAPLMIENQWEVIEND